MKKNFGNWKNSFNIGSSEENSDSENKLYIENDEGQGVKYRVIHLENISEYMESFCIRKYCSWKRNGRNGAHAGLATKFLLKSKQLILFLVHITMVFMLPQNRGNCMKLLEELLGSRIIGKGCTGLHKFCSVVSDVTPVCKQRFSEHAIFT